MTDESHYLAQAIEAFEGQRGALGDAVVNAALQPLRERLAAIRSAQRDTSMQRKLVTVLFADVSGFTALVESMDPEDVTITMNALWSRLDAAILAEGGTIDKHIGDAVMALFGAPVAREDDPEHAIRAALAMQQQLGEFVKAEEARSAGRFSSLKMRIGINTGLVLVGPVGTTAEYTALGDTVNTASRLEHAAPVGGILISHDTYRHVRGIFEVTRLEPIIVKGKREPIQVYLAEGIRPRAFRVTTRGVVGVETPTIGREAELAALQDAWKASRKAARVVTVVADAGTGKSRLLYEFGKWMDEQPDRFRLFKGRSTEDMERLPYSLMRDLFVFQFEIQESDSAAVAREKLEKGIREIVGADHAEQIPFIGHLIGFDYSNHPALRGIIGDARQVRDRAYYYMVQLFKQIMRQQPLVLYLEDLHWADGDSLNLLEHIIIECRNLPLFGIALSRTTLFERYQTWGQNERTYKRLDLKPLSPESIRELVSFILQRVPAIPESLYELILSRADGNPFYVEEVIKMMIEEGIIKVGEKVWMVDLERLAGLKVPPTLTGVLQARLDGLAAFERKTLQRASVLGRIFWDTALPHLQDVVGDEIQVSVVDDYLHQLQKRELVFERDLSAFSGSNEYIFKHAILRDVTYESVLIQIRKVYHAQAASWLVERSGERINEFAGRIGEHYERAGEAARAADWYIKAAAQARKTYAVQIAHDYYKRALELWDESNAPTQEIAPQRIEAYDGLGSALNSLGRVNEAIEAFTRMREIAESAGDSPATARAWLEIAGTHIYSKGEVRAGLEGAQQAEKVARQANAEPELATALQIQCWATFRLGDPEAAQALGEEALAISRRVDNQVEIGRTLNVVGFVQYLRGQYEPAIRYLEEALSLFQELGQKGEAINLLNNLGVIAESLGDYHGAYARYDSAISMAREIGERSAEIRFVSNRGSASVGLGNYDAALVDLLEAIEVSKGEGFSLMAETYRNLGRAYLGLGQPQEALKAARQALASGQELEAQDDVAGAWRVLGQIASRLGKSVSVKPDLKEKSRNYTPQQCFQQSLDIYASMEMEGERARTLRAWARHELSNGDAQKGEAMWNEARDIFTRLGAPLEAERMADLPQSES